MKKQLIAAALMLAPFAAAASTAETALATIESGLTAKNPDTRKDGVQALAVLGWQPKYQARLEAMLHDKDMQVRLAVVAGLAESKDAAGLRQALDDRTPEVRFAAAKALFAMHDPAGERALIRILSGQSRTSSGLIAEQKRDALRLLQTPRPLIKMAMDQGVGMIPVPYVGMGYSVMQKVVMGSGKSDRAATALLLGKADSPEAIAVLESSLGDKDARLRAAAIQAIAMSDKAELAKDAEPLLTDKNRSVRLRAAACYLRLSSIDSYGPGAEE